MAYERTPEIREKNRKAAIAAYERDASLKQRVSQSYRPEVREAISGGVRLAHAEGKFPEVGSNKGRTFSAETRKRQSDAHKGRSPWNKGKSGLYRHSPEVLAKMSASQKGKPRLYARQPHPDGCKHCEAVLAYMSRFPRPETAIERKLYRLLSAAAFGFERQRRFGRYVVDAYVPSRHLAFEADGATWHSYPEQVSRDKLRDAYLLREFGLPVVRLTERELVTMEVRD